MARELFLDFAEDNLLNESDLDCLYNNMNTLLTECGQTEYMTYEVFRDLKSTLPKRAHELFTASIYRGFKGNEFGWINAFEFYQFVSLSVNMIHQYITLSSSL